MIIITINPKFPLGDLVVTTNAIKQLGTNDITTAVNRHARGDWGDACPEDRLENEYGLRDGFRLLSVYRSAKGIPFWIITEGDRSVTTVLLPEDY